MPRSTMHMKHEDNNWDKMVHAPFKKVVKFDLVCMGIGVMMGIGAYLVTSGLFR